MFTREGEPNYTIPYDFDQSGLVDAPHAAPNERFGLRTVRDRLYRGRCSNNDHLPSTLRQFNDKRSDIEALIKDQRGLSKRKGKAMLSYINEFYDTINNPRHLNRDIVKKCI
jgi:hypothetical protein